MHTENCDYIATMCDDGKLVTSCPGDLISRLPLYLSLIPMQGLPARVCTREQGYLFTIFGRERTIYFILDSEDVCYSFVVCKQCEAIHVIIICEVVDN